MKEDFYEILGVRADAPPEDIKKAYRKRALQTHPDRLPPGATAEDKQASEEQFRKVNNAYEILMEPKNRKLYDLYGVWPPPEEIIEDGEPYHKHRPGAHGPFGTPANLDEFFDRPFSSPFEDPFSRRYRPRPTPIYRDPFELFNAIFADIQHELYRGPDLWSGPPFSPFWDSPNSVFGRHVTDHRPSPLFPPIPIFRQVPDFPAFPDEHMAGSSRPSPHREMSFESRSRGFYGPYFRSDGPQWVSEQRTVRTVNGVTQSMWKRRDSSGNEHITYTYPDGREKYTVNGIEQPHPTYNIQNVPSDGSSDSDYASPKPLIPPEHVEEPSRKPWWRRR